MNVPLIQELEEAVVDAWPAADTEDLDGWLLRKSDGPSRRGNSVSTHAGSGALPLVERIERAEAWYRERGRTPVFQIGPCATPDNLDATLAERGYIVEAEASCMLSTPGAILSSLPRRLEASVALRPSDAWLQIAGRSGRFASSYDVFLGFLSRLGTRCRFVTARAARGEAIATCFCVSSEARLGVYSMYTLPGARRRGAGATLLRACAESAFADGMKALYLLVERENEAARKLTLRAGFQDVYAYHYRVLA